MNNLLTTKNISLLITGIVVLIIGYILLAQGPCDNPLSLNVAPFFLIAGYCVIIPLAIIIGDDNKKKEK